MASRDVVQYKSPLAVAFKFFKLGRGAAIALTLLIVTIILGKLLVRIFEKPKSERV